MEIINANDEKYVEIIDCLKRENDVLKSQNAELSAQVSWLMEQIRLAKHRRFSPSSEKSEYDSISQLNLFNEPETLADANVTEPSLSEVKKHYRKRREAGDRLPPDLPVEIVEHSLPEEERICPECEGPLHVMGREAREELKLIPAQAVIVRHVKQVYSCRECEKNECGVPIVKAAVSEPVIKGSFASPEAVAHIMTQKFVSGVPLYRQEQEFARNGINLSRQTMSNWLIKCSEDYLTPIYDCLREMLVSRKILHLDETTLQVLHEPGKAPQSKSYMWLYRTSGDANFPIILYDYQPDRKAIHPKEFLKGFSGYIHTDGYSAYHSFPKNVTVVGCFAHARRKFKDALKGLAPKDQVGSGAFIGKTYCDKLFEIEKELSGLTSSERHAKRQETAKPILEEFLAWLHSREPAPKTGFGQAVKYVLGQWEYLVNYMLDGRLEISNNRAERSIKPFVICRKNFLFANTPRGAKASAVIFSLIETAKENGLNPYAYLAHIFRTAPNYDIRNDVEIQQLLLPNFVPDFCKAGYH